MSDQLWNLFRETGDPMGYLLYRAEKDREKRKTQKKEPPEKKPEPERQKPVF